MRMHSRRVLEVGLVSAVALGACKPNETTETPGETPVKGSDPVEAVELAPVDHPSQLLPRDTALLVTTQGFERLAEIIDRKRLVGTFSAQYMGVTAMMRGSIGYDLLDPEAWNEVGLDASGPMALSLSDVANARLVVFATVSDRARLVAFVQEMAGKAEAQLIEQQFGSASVWRPPNSNGALVLRDDLAAFVVEGREQEGFDLPQVIATMDPNLSLAAQVSYRKSTGGLRESDMGLFVDVGKMVAQLNAQSEARNSTPQQNWAQERLVEAQKEGADQEQLKHLAEQAEEERKRQARWRARDEGERELAALFVSGIEGFAASATFKNNGPIVDGRIVADETAFLRRVLSNRDGAPRLTHSMNGAPIWCLSGDVVGDAAFELLPPLAKAEGQSYPEMLAEVKAGIGLDLEADVRPVLSGHAELCATIEDGFDVGSKTPVEHVGLGVILPLSDAAQGPYLLAKMASSGSELAAQMRKRGAGYDVKVPDWRTVHLEPVPAGLLITTDDGLAGRLAAGDPGSMPSKIKPQGARGAINLPGTAASQAFDLSLLSLMFVGTTSSFESVAVAPGMSEEEMAKVPHSKKSKKARKALQKANDALQDLQRQRSAADVTKVLQIMDPLGIMSIAAEEDDRGFTLTGGMFIRAESMGVVVEGLMRAAMLTGPEPEDAELRTKFDAAWETKMQADQAYTEARTEDAERANKKKKR